MDKLFFIFVLIFNVSLANANLGECRFKSSVILTEKLKNSIIPALKKIAPPNEEKINFFQYTQKVAGVAMMFYPPAGVAIPFALLADILMSPVSGIRKIISKIDYKKKSKVKEQQLIKATEEFKMEWEKIEPNIIKRKLLINELYVFSLVSAVHSFEVNLRGEGTIENREDYNFIIPYISKYLGQEIKMGKDGMGKPEWKIKKNKVTFPLYRYFHLEDFQRILEANPKFCESPGLDALDIIGIGFAKIITEKMAKY